MRHLTAEKRDRIAAALGKLANDKALAYIDMLIGDFLEMHAQDQEHPRTLSRLKAERKKLQAKAANAKEALVNLSQALELASPWAIADVGDQSLTDNIDQTITKIDAIAGMKQGTGSKHGRPVKIWQRVLLNRLAFTWCKATGKKATISFDSYKDKPTGPYFKFVMACVEGLPGFSANPNTIAAAAKKAVKGTHHIR